jgi:MFS family permease
MAASPGRIVAFVNIAHALDHYLLLIYPTAVIALAAQWQADYPTLIGLATGTYVAFGLFALPVGWIADRIGQRTLMAAFYLGCGAGCFGLASAASETALAVWLLVLGLFTAIYHPVGSALLVANARSLGRTLGINGVWGNLGAAAAPGMTGLLVATFGWQAGFIVPGVVCVMTGIAFLALVPPEVRGKASAGAKSRPAAETVARPVLLAVLFMAAVVAGGFTFNMTSITMPKVIDERLDMTLPLVLTGSLTTIVLVFGAAAQLTMGRLVDRLPLPRLFAALAVLQPVGLGLAALSTGLPMLLGLVLATAAIFGQVVVNDAMVARYVPERLRSRAYGLRYFFGFTTSGFAVPMIAFLHDADGFPLVLGVAALFGLVIFGSALAFLACAGPRQVQPAE